MSRPIAVAVTGGIGAGKSEALASFARHGAAVVSSDEIVHHLLRTDDGVKHEIVTKLGHGVVGPDGSVDRGAVAQIVFRDRRLLSWLEGLLHPRVAAEYLRWREQLAELPNPPLVCVTEVPLLFESGAEGRFDKVVVITAPRKLREARTHKVLQADREKRLISDREKLKRADYAYVNTGGLEELDAFVAKVMADLTGAQAP